MNSKRSLIDIGEVYGKLLNNLVTERCKTAATTFAVASDKKVKPAKASDKAFAKNTGPEASDGFNKDNIDPKCPKADKNFHQPKKFSVNCEKTKTTDISTSMSKSFDQLFKEVLTDRHVHESPDQLEADAGLEGDVDPSADPSIESDAEGALDMPEGEDEMLSDRAKIQKAMDLLQQVADALPEDEAEGDLGDDLDSLPGGEGEDNEELGGDEGLAKETTEMKELSDSAGKTLQGKNNKVSGTAGKASGGKADHKVTDKVTGNETLPDSAGQKLQGKNNKVDSKIKPGKFAHDV